MEFPVEIAPPPPPPSFYLNGVQGHEPFKLECVAGPQGGECCGRCPVSNLRAPTHITGQSSQHPLQTDDGETVFKVFKSTFLGGNVDAFTLERHSITNSFKPEIDPFFLRAAGQ